MRKLVATILFLSLGFGCEDVGDFDNPKNQNSELKLTFPKIDLPIDNGPIPAPTLTDPSIVASNEVGTLPGMLSVNDSGQARYEVPIRVPKGRRGLQPNLQLSYKSGSSNGWAGVGWDLDGVSSITRCAPSPGRHESVEGFNFDTEDKFCLNGQYLVAISGKYGGSGTEYRLERNPRWKIVSTGSFRGGPLEFTVWDDEKRIHRFSTRFEGEIARSYSDDGSTGYVRQVVWGWGKTFTHDRFGNAIWYKWITDTTDGYSFLPSKIIYGYAPKTPGQIEYPTTTPTPPYRQVDIGWEPRPDTIDQYTAGFHHRLTKRLKFVKTFVVDAPKTKQPILSYNLDYIPSPDTARSLVNSVQLCERFDRCLPKTTFTYQHDGRAGFYGGTDFNLPYGEYYASPIIDDFDGDGRDDFFVTSYVPAQIASVPAYDTCSNPAGEKTANCNGFRASGFAVYRSNGGFTYNREIEVSLPVGAFYGAQAPKVEATLDYDLDGRADILMSNGPDSQGFALYDFDFGSRTIDMLQELSPTFQSLPLPGQYQKTTWIGDFDGDRYPDIIKKKYDHWTYYNNKSSSSSPGFEPGHPLTVNASGSEALVTNPSSDRRSYFYSTDDDRYNFFTMRGALPVAFTGTTNMPASKGNLLSLDINGDGLADVLDLHRCKIRFNTGLYYGPEQPCTVDPSDEINHAIATYDWPIDDVNNWTDLDRRIHVADFNNDGRMDVLMMGKTCWDSVDLPDNEFACSYRAEPELYLSEGVHFKKHTWADVEPWFNSKDVSVFDHDGDGLVDLFINKFKSADIFHRNGKMPDYLSSVTDGYGKLDRLEYTTTTNRQVYTPSTTCLESVRCNTNRLPIVASLKRDNGFARAITPPFEYNETRYYYSGGRFDHKGSGFLGFSVVRVHDLDAQRITERRYSLDFPIGGVYTSLGLPDSETVYQRLAVNRASVHTTLSSNFTRQVYPGVWLIRRAIQSDRTFEISSSSITVPPITTTLSAITGAVAPLKTATQIQLWDDYGNNVYDEYKVAYGTTHLVETDYDYRPSDWLIDLPKKSTISSTAADGTSDTFQVDRTFYPKGDVELATKTGAGSLDQTTRFMRHPIDGLLVRMERSGPSEPVRSRSYHYDSERIFIIGHENAANHLEQFTWDRGLNIETSAIDPNENQHFRQYDGFGRAVKVTDANGLVTAIDYLPTASGAVRIETAANDGRKTYAIIDELGRRTESAKWLEGKWSKRILMYNKAGRVELKSLPHFAGATPSYERWNYDRAGRVTEVISPDGASSIRQYTGLQVSAKDATNNWRHLLYNTDGGLAESSNFVDGETILTSYIYGPFNRLEKVAGHDGTVTDKMDYDSFGRLVLSTNANTGARTYEYNAFNEISKSIDANGDVTSFVLDNLGRTQEIHSPDGKTTFEWDTGLKPSGAPVVGLHMSESHDGVISNYVFDEMGRRVEEQLKIQGRVLNLKTAYDTYGRIDSLTYPPSPKLGQLKVDYNYGTDGRLDYIKDAIRGDVLWRAISRDAWGRSKTEKMGDDSFYHRTFDSTTGRLSHIRSVNGVGAVVQDTGYTYNDAGLLDGRQDHMEGRLEEFGYDEAYRLNDWQDNVLGGSSSSYSFGYDKWGNMTSSNSVDGIHNYTYDGVTGPHTVSHIDGQAIGYDTLGRRISGPEGPISYTSYNLPKQFEHSSKTTYLSYDASRRRVHKQQGAEKFYFPGFYDLQDDGGQETHTHYIRTPERVVAQIVDDGGSAKATYYHPDGLGSTSVLTGAINEKRRFSPFGLRIGGSDAVSIGFTGHEHDRGYINMSGRIFDPATRRFLTPDPLVSFPSFSQSFNRYSYALNSPLTFVDPSGFRPEGAPDGAPDWYVYDGEPEAPEQADEYEWGQDYDISDFHDGADYEQSEPDGPGSDYGFDRSASDYEQSVNDAAESVVSAALGPAVGSIPNSFAARLYNSMMQLGGSTPWQNTVSIGLRRGFSLHMQSAAASGAADEGTPVFPAPINVWSPMTLMVDRGGLSATAPISGRTPGFGPTVQWSGMTLLGELTLALTAESPGMDAMMEVGDGALEAIVDQYVPAEARGYMLEAYMFNLSLEF